MSVKRENVKGLRLATGEDIIGEVVDPASVGSFLAETAANAFAKTETPDVNKNITMNTPLLVIQKIDENQKIKFSFYPWLPCSNGKQVLVKEAIILAVYTPADEMVKKYAEVFSDITLPDKHIVKV